MNFGRSWLWESSLLIPISRRAGQASQLSLKCPLLISEFGPWGKEEGATGRTWLHPPQPSALASRTYCNCRALPEEERITTCSPRRENKQPLVPGGGDIFKGYLQGLKPKEVPSRASWKSVLSLHLGLPVSGYQSLPAGAGFSSYEPHIRP